MAKKPLGFYTGDIAIPPYLTQAEIQEDCEAGNIPDVFRKGEKGNNIIHRRYVEGYYRSKSLPDFVIEDKLKSLGIFSSKEMATEINRMAQSGGVYPDQLSLLPFGAA